MAGPQLEDGYTSIANEILDQLSKVQLNDTQHRILLVVWRMTYGWRRKECRLSNSFLSEATDIDERVVRREFQRLVDRNIIVVVSKATGTAPRIVSFNKHYSDWLGRTKESSLKEGRTKKTPLGRTKKTPLERTKKTPNKERNKEITKGFDLRSVYDHYQTLGLINHRSYTADMQRAIESAMKNNHYDIDYCKTLLDRHKQVVEITKTSDYKVKARSLYEFFGQKVFGAKNLICSEYEEGGKLFEKHLKQEKAAAIDITGYEVVYQDG